MLHLGFYEQSHNCDLDPLFKCNTWELVLKNMFNRNIKGQCMGATDQGQKYNNITLLKTIFISFLVHTFYLC